MHCWVLVMTATCVFIVIRYGHNLQQLCLIIEIMNVLSSVYLDYCQRTCCNVISFLSRHDIAVSHVLIQTVSWHMTSWRCHDTVTPVTMSWHDRNKTKLVHATLCVITTPTFLLSSQLSSAAHGPELRAPQLDCSHSWNCCKLNIEYLIILRNITAVQSSMHACHMRVKGILWSVRR